VTEKDATGRVYVSTYPTMMGLIDETTDGRRRFGPGHFDLIVIDEAHRSVYRRCGRIFDYFDSFRLSDSKRRSRRAKAEPSIEDPPSTAI
jgi:type I restriction enzyme R subunit